jgi:alkaline phosphatase D
VRLLAFSAHRYGLTTTHSYSAQNSTTPLFHSANTAFQLYQGAANPSTASPDSEAVNWHFFRNGDAAFFVLDTRKYRSPNHLPDGPSKTMLGEVQKRVFGDWLATVNQTVTWKFVVSSVPFMTLWDSGVASAKDTFAAFTHERAELLDLMEYVPKWVERRHFS